MSRKLSRGFWQRSTGLWARKRLPRKNQQLQAQERGLRLLWDRTQIQLTWRRKAHAVLRRTKWFGCSNILILWQYKLHVKQLIRVKHALANSRNIFDVLFDNWSHSLSEKGNGAQLWKLLTCSQSLRTCLWWIPSHPFIAMVDFRDLHPSWRLAAGLKFLLYHRFIRQVLGKPYAVALKRDCSFFFRLWL